MVFAPNLHPIQIHLQPPLRAKFDCCVLKLAGKFASREHASFLEKRTGIKITRNFTATISQYR
ncbi:hypothetical protein RHECNPAF_1330054 [Rhizobium etli CNPAF512]|nr:hypothetical protein RHECNPAF_1330054 [Rhizobium etli CNPAF512]